MSKVCLKLKPEELNTKHNGQDNATNLFLNNLFYLYVDLFDLYRN